jgi:hypothetical protein
MSFASLFTPSAFVQALSEVRLKDVFNPYSDICQVYDLPEGARIRRKNLETLLCAALENKVNSLWIARDLGYRGGRRTGLALTDEVHLNSLSKRYCIPDFNRATKGPLVAERTASIIWKSLTSIEASVFLWNIFPFQPYRPGFPFSNRCHTRAERHSCQNLLIWLLESLRPSITVAIGRDASLALKNLGIDVVTLRHPSYGGKSEFLSGVAKLYGISIRREPEPVQTELELDYD